MSPCLSDEALLLVHYGEGADADHAHLRSCLRCSARHRQLVRDLATIDHALKEAPPAVAARDGRATVGPRRLAAAAVVAAVLGLVGMQVWMSRQAAPIVAHVQSVRDADVPQFLDEVSRVLLASEATDSGEGSDIAATAELGSNGERDE